MNIATLRFEGPDDALKRIRGSLALDADSEWRVGEVRRSGKVHPHSGFNVTIADVATPREMEDEVRRFLGTVTARGISFTEYGLTCELSIGIGVGLEEQFVAGVTFSPEDLLTLAELGLALDLTAYTCSMDEEAQEEPVDFAEAGVLRAVSDRGASILTPSGGTIEVTWRRGRVAWSSEGSFALTGATEDDLTFTSTKVFFTVQKEGNLPPPDRIPPVCQAR